MEFSPHYPAYDSYFTDIIGLIAVMCSVGTPLKTTCKLQLVKNSVAYMLSGFTRYYYVSLVLQEVHWLLQVFQAQFQGLVITYIVLYSLGPGYLKNCLTIQLSA